MATSFLPLNGHAPRLEYLKIQDSIGGEYVRAVLGNTKTEFVVSSLNNNHPEPVLIEMWNALVLRETAVHTAPDAQPMEILAPVQTTTHLAVLRSALQACTKESQVFRIQRLVCPGIGCMTRRSRAAQNAINATLAAIRNEIKQEFNYYAS